jgi:hypothetical protein
MILGTDNTNTVRLVAQGTDLSAMPTEWNGLTLTAHVLTDAQLSSYNSLSNWRSYTMFDGATFTAGADEVHE